MKVKVKLLHKDAKIPFRANPTDAGADLFSTEEVVINPLERKAVSTGLAIEIPFLNSSHYYGRIAPRSGLALKSGIDVMAGVVDSSYRGEIKVILFNTNKEPFKISKGDKIAQIIIEACYNFDFEQEDELSSTARGSDGFGSTG